MLLTYFMVGIAFAIPELIIVYNFKPLQNFIEKSPIIELVFSLGLSMVLAWSMGIGIGVTVAVANVFSTVITLAFYHFKVVERYHAFVVACRNAKAQLSQTADELSEIIHVVWVVIVGPFLGVLWVLKKLNAAIAFVHHPRAKRA